MKTLIYSTKPFEKPFLQAANTKGYEVITTSVPLTIDTVIRSAGYDVVSVFTADDVSGPVLEALYRNGVRYVAIRAAGYDNVDLRTATALRIKVANVPAYSPYAIAEHALALMLALNRKLIIADKQVHRHDFRTDNLVGFNLHGKTIGIIGTGTIGGTLIKLLHGFGCRLLGYDVIEVQELTESYDLQYVSLAQLCSESDIISMHTPHTTATHHLINEQLLNSMKKGVMLINTARGGCINTVDLITCLENGHIGYYGADVYEREKGIFFQDWSHKELDDDMLETLLQLPNVLITPHQAFATAEALSNITATTFHNIDCWARGQVSVNELTPLAAPVLSNVNIL